MTFTAPLFLPFLLAVMVACAAVGRSRRWLVLLVASYAFYATWSPLALPAVLAAVTLASYFCARGIARHQGSRRGRTYFWLGLGAAAGALVALRYVAFLAENLNALAAVVGRPAVLPVVTGLVSVGVSYYVLQAISYLIDVRDGVLPPERHLGRYALSLAFFPKLVQGPIERAERLLPQLHDPLPLRARDVAAAAQLFLWGLFQKLVVADRLAPFVDAVYADVRHHEGLPILVATYFFAAQLYFDFAGYTDMALGIARLFGIRLTPNFAAPYLARSVAEFWRRWHISFSSWLLDYVFRPLQLELRRWRRWGTPVALVATFLVSGLWHGASWNFVVWGLLHGLFVAASTFYRPWQHRLHAALGIAGSRLLAAAQVVATFHLVCFAWIFFRAGSVRDALDATRLVVSGMPSTLARLVAGLDLDALLYLGQGRAAFVSALLAVAVGTGLRALLARAGITGGAGGDEPALVASWWPWARTALYAFMLYGVLVLGTSAQAFLYAQF